MRLKNKLNTSNITQNAKIIINKLLSHSELAIIQKITISEPIIELEKKLSKELEETEKLKKRLEEEIRNILPQIIGVMGVFATIIFAVFNGFNEVTTLGSALEKTPVSKIFIFVGLSLLFLLTIMFISYVAMGYFYGKSLNACCNDKNCDHSIFEKHPIMFSFSWIAFSLVSIGFVMVIFRDYVDLTDIVVYNSKVIFIILTVVLLIIPLMGIVYVIRNSIWKLLKNK